MTSEVQKGVPIPVFKAGRRRKYDFEIMEVGDSFFSTDYSQKVMAAACQYVKRHANDKKFRCKSVTEKNDKGFDIKGIRVWRVT